MRNVLHSLGHLNACFPRSRTLWEGLIGVACIVLGEECGSYINESGLVEQNIQRLKDLQGNL